MFKIVQLGGSISGEMLRPFHPFKISNSVGNSMESYTKELKKKKDISININEAKNFLVDAGFNVIGKKIKID